MTDDSPDAALPADHVRIEAHVPVRDGSRLAAELQRFLTELAHLDPTLALARLEVRPLPDTNWEETFRAHHHPRRIGRRLYVAPPWDVPAAGDRELIVIDPSMAFGTGQHATTRTCLEECEAAVDDGPIARALDVGTGSGILAIALARLGVRHVVGVDIDPDAIRLAHLACVDNAVPGVHLLIGPAGALRDRYDLVIANLLADTIVDEAATLAERVAPCGRLVLSGLLTDQIARVTAAFAGWAVTAVRKDDPWRTLRLERPS